MPVQQFGVLLKSPQLLKRHLIKVNLIALGLAFLSMVFLDQQLSVYFAIEDVRAFAWQTARTATDLALSEIYFGAALLIWIFTAWIAPRMEGLKKYSAKLDFYRRWSLNLFAALIVSGIMTHLIKFTVGRQRPHKSPDFDPFVFDPMTTHWHWHSFSSGHTQVIFTVATMMGVAFPRFRWVWLFVAGLICSTRIIIHDHFLSDTIYGACVGYMGTLLTLKLMMKKTKNGLY